MRYEVRARSIGEMMDGALQIYRDNLRLLLTLSIVIYGPMYAISDGVMYMGGAAQGGVQAAKAVLTTSFVSLPVFLLAYVLGRLAFTVAIVRAFRGETCRVRDALAQALNKFWPALGSDMILGLGTWVCSIALVIPGLLFFFNRLLNVQAIVVEGKGAVASLSRSKELVRGAGYRGTWAWFFTSLLTAAVSFGFTAVIPGSVPWLAKQALAAIPYLVLAPLAPAVLTLAYFDSRVRKEGFDLSVLAEQTLGVPRPPSAEPAR
jgi:hypothetical protein